jgi:hypothetical protein
MAIRAGQVCVLAGAAMMMATVLPAGAQRRPDMVLNKAVSTMAQAKAARRALMLGVQCLLDQRPTNVRSFLKMYPDSRDGVRAAGYLNSGDCVDGQAGGQPIRFGPAMLRGVIYKVMYQRAFADRAPALRPSIDFAADVKGQPDPSGAAYLAAREFATCVVRRDPAAARSLVLAEVESADELNALGAVQPTFEGCMQKGQVELSRSGVTGVIAEVLYRLSASGDGRNA